MFLTPEKPITPHEAGMQAAMNSMGGRSYSPQTGRGDYRKSISRCTDGLASTVVLRLC